MNLYHFYDTELKPYIDYPNDYPEVHTVYVLAANDQDARKFLADKRGEKWLDPQRCVIEESWKASSAPQEVLVQVQSFDNW